MNKQLFFFPPSDRDLLQKQKIKRKNLYCSFLLFYFSENLFLFFLRDFYLAFVQVACYG